MMPMENTKTGTPKILQSEVSSSPDTTTNVGEEKVDSHYSTHQKATASIKAYIC